MLVRVLRRLGRPSAAGMLALLGLVLPLQIASPQERGRPVLLLFGDSLTAGYGLEEDQGFPAQLRRALAKNGWDVDVRNAGVSGDTTAGGLARLDWTLAEGHVDAAVLELGANDALRGLSPEQAKGNLDQILTRLQARNIKVLLAGMLAPPNLGNAYYTRFAGIYPDLAKQHGVPLYPFFLEGVASHGGLNQPDGIHPNERGVAVIVQRITPAVVGLLRLAGPQQSAPAVNAAVRTEAPVVVRAENAGQ